MLLRRDTQGNDEEERAARQYFDTLFSFRSVPGPPTIVVKSKQENTRRGQNIMNEALKLNKKEYLHASEEGHAVDAAKDAERPCREKQEQIAAQMDDLRHMGIEGLRLPSTPDFWTDRGLMSIFLERAKEEDH